MPSAGRVTDWVLGLAIAVLAVTYVVAWPPNFLLYDEGLYLYEAKRMVEGAVPYRDFFEFVTPVCWYLMALAFALFGATLATARGVMAVVHAANAWLVFACGRRLGVRRPLAVAGAVAVLAIAFPGMAIATPHWFSTLGTLTLLWVLLAPHELSLATAARAGLVVGTVIL